jgi:hypothetical protein
MLTKHVPNLKNISFEARRGKDQISMQLHICIAILAIVP